MSVIRITLVILLAALTGCATLNTLYPSRYEREFGEPDRNFTKVNEEEKIPLSATIATNPKQFAEGINSLFADYLKRKEAAAFREIRTGRPTNPDEVTNDQQYTLPQVTGAQGKVLATNAEIYLSVYNQANNPDRSRLVFNTNLPEQTGVITCGTVFVGITADSPDRKSLIQLYHDDFFCVETNDGEARLVNMIGEFRGLTQANLEHWAYKDPAAWQAVEAARKATTEDEAVQTRLSHRDAIICDETGEYCGDHYTGPQLLHHAVRQGTENGCWKVWLLTFGRATQGINEAGTSAISRHYARFITCDDVTEEGLPLDR